MIVGVTGASGFIGRKTVKNLIESGCYIKGDIETKKIVNVIELASEKDWHTEYLDAILSIKLVDGVLGAIDLSLIHI